MFLPSQTSQTSQNSKDRDKSRSKLDNLYREWQSRKTSCSFTMNTEEKKSCCKILPRQQRCKIVHFDSALNVYIEPNHAVAEQWTNETLMARRNGTAMVAPDSRLVLRLLSVHRSWTESKTKRQQQVEEFEDFLRRSSPRLYKLFYVNRQFLL